MFVSRKIDHSLSDKFRYENWQDFIPHKGLLPNCPIEQAERQRQIKTAREAMRSSFKFIPIKTGGGKY